MGSRVGPRYRDEPQRGEQLSFLQDKHDAGERETGEEFLEGEKEKGSGFNFWGTCSTSRSPSR